MMMVTRSAIVAEARAYIRTPWVHMGREPGLALDCAGVLICVARSLGLVARTFDVPAYSMQPDGKALVDWCNRFMGRRLERAQLQPGDAVVVITDRDPQHLGIVGDYRSGGLSIIHASNSLSVVPPRVIETRLMFSRVQRFVAGYAFPNVSDAA